MTLCAKSLQSLIMECQQISEPQLWIFIDQIATALEGIHAMGLIHTNIKPSHILINDQGYLMLSDFSNCIQIGENIKYYGNQAYLAPECFTDANKVSYKSDIFSVGLCLYQLICGIVQLPTTGQGYQSLRQEKLKFPKNRISGLLKSTIRQMTKPLIEERISLQYIKNYFQSPEVQFMNTIDPDLMKAPLPNNTKKNMKSSSNENMKSSKQSSNY